MSLLRIENLTMRFGGLTAVNAVSLAVEPGQIHSIIGPNGAGKTTLFNAVTGIYNPTSGTVEFDGKQQYRPLRFASVLGFLAAALILGGALGLLAVNVDRLWLATIKKQRPTEEKPFSYEVARGDLLDYFQNNLVFGTNRYGDRWKITYPGGENVNPSIESEENAKKIYALLKEGKLPALQKKGDDFVALFDGIDEPVFAPSDLEEDAQKDLAKLVAFQQQRGDRIFNALLGFGIGATLGLLGSIAVWRRSRRTTDYIALGGIARTFQNIRLFQNMTVLENVLVGLDRSLTRGPLHMACRSPWHRRAERGAEEEALELLKFMNLETRRDALAKNLPYGDQRRLEIARAMACAPKLLLLDEPAAGMNPRETVELMDLIRRIRERGITILLIEHHMNLVMGISDHITVLDYGAKIADGTPDEVRANPKVIEAYLGKEEVT